MSNRISILLEQGLPISQILFSHQRNDIIESTFLNDSLVNSEDEINYAKLFSADIELKEEKDLFFESENSIQKYNKSSIKNIFNLSKKKKIMKDKKGKRGRKIKKENNSLEKRKTHKKTDFDNLLRKIQVHFLNFLIDFCNEALKTEFANFPFSFKRINANTKEKINSKNVTEFKEKTINDLLHLDISSKYKRFQKTHNKNLLKNERIKNSKWLNDLFNIKYIELFNDYYNDRFPSNKKIFKNKIILTKNTKNFYYLLEQNKDIRKELINTSIDVFGFGFKPFSISDSN